MDIIYLSPTDRIFQKERSLVSTTDELIPDNIILTETNRDLHAAASAICSGSKPKGCNTELVRVNLCTLSVFLEQVMKSKKQRVGEALSLSHSCCVLVCTGV